MKTVSLPDGTKMPALGIGTWHMGERAGELNREVNAISAALDNGVGLIDTAEMYAEGGAEKVVGKAVRGRRDDVFIVSKVYPHNASMLGAVDACERSLARLECDYIDLYLLHWRGNADIEATLEGFTRLRDDAKIRYFGVSNFDVDDMRDWYRLDGGNQVGANQILFNLMRRWPEAELLPWQRARRIPTMAYTPLEPVRRGAGGALAEVAAKHAATPAQIALAWLLNQADVMTIPKASDTSHVIENVRALDIELDGNDLSRLEQDFPPPLGPSPIEML